MGRDEVGVVLVEGEPVAAVHGAGWGEVGSKGALVDGRALFRDQNDADVVSAADGEGRADPACDGPVGINVGDGPLADRDVGLLYGLTCLCGGEHRSHPRVGDRQIVGAHGGRSWSPYTWVARTGASQTAQGFGATYFQACSGISSELGALRGGVDFTSIQTRSARAQGPR